MEKEITELSKQYHVKYREMGTKEAALYYGKSERTIINWCNNGTLPNCKKPSKDWIIYVLTNKKE